MRPLQSLWDYTFNDKLHVDPSNHKILLTEPPLNPKRNRVQMCERMFEKYGFGAANVSIQAMLTLYAQGLLTGARVPCISPSLRPLSPLGSGARPQSQA
jgi:actin-related protein 2